MTKQIQYKFWLTFDEKGGAPKATKSQPATSMRQRAMLVSVAIPASVFSTPQLSATITIDEKASPRTHIDAKAVEAAISGAVDGHVILTIVDQTALQS